MPTFLPSLPVYPIIRSIYIYTQFTYVTYHSLYPTISILPFYPVYLLNLSFAPSRQNITIFKKWREWSKNVNTKIKSVPQETDRQTDRQLPFKSSDGAKNVKMVRKRQCIYSVPIESIICSIYVIYHNTS